MRLLIDMNLSPRWVGWFAQRGIEAIHWSAVGAPDAADRVLMQFAAEQGRILLTQDLDFGAILAASGASAPSVVLVRHDDPRPELIGEGMLRALLQVEQDLQRGALMSFEPDRPRVRLLPLRSKP